MNPKKFFGELKRRNVYRVAVAYVLAGWALAQGIAQVFPVFDIPNWVVRLIVLVIALGFPAVRRCLREPPIEITSCRKSRDRIDYFYEWEAMEIGVAGVNFANAVLAHQHCGMRVVQNGTAQMRNLGNHFIQ